MTYTKLIAPILLCLAATVVKADNAMIVESSVGLNMSWLSDNVISIPQIYQVEIATAAYLRTLMEAQGLRPDESLIDFQVDITDEKTQQGRTQLLGNAKALYLTDMTPLSLNSTLTALTEQDQLLGLNRVLKLVDTNVSGELKLTFSASQNRADLGTVIFDSSRSTTSTSLIVVCALLAIMLLLVSNVLLYVTGGWKLCQQRCNSCLFEEVEDDYAVAKKSTFQVQSYDDGEQTSDPKSNDDDEFENQSVVTDNPDGMLGGAERIAGLGVQTPMRGDGDDMSTTMSDIQQTPAPLGIRSMRKLPPPDTPDVEGGLSHLMMKRLTAPYYSNNNN